MRTRSPTEVTVREMSLEHSASGDAEDVGYALQGAGRLALG